MASNEQLDLERAIECLRSRGSYYAEHFIPHPPYSVQRQRKEAKAYGNSLLRVADKLERQGHL